MTRDDHAHDVSAAFEILLDEVEVEIDLLNSVAADAIKRAEDLTAFRDRLAVMRKEWLDMARAGHANEEEAERRKLRKLRKGLRTPEEAYYRPILESLLALGAKGRVGEVLDRVYERMATALNEHDHQPLRSDPDMPRWRKAAQWARYSMMKEGLLRADSPRGEWEITELGRAWLQRERKENGELSKQTSPQPRGAATR